MRAWFSLTRGKLLPIRRPVSLCKNSNSFQKAGSRNLRLKWKYALAPCSAATNFGGCDRYTEAPSFETRTILESGVGCRFIGNPISE